MRREHDTMTMPTESAHPHGRLSIGISIDLPLTSPSMKRNGQASPLQAAVSNAGCLSERVSRRVFGLFLLAGAWPCLLHGTSGDALFLSRRAADSLFGGNQDHP